MTKEEFKQLELLLAKLGHELQTYKIGIVTGWMQDGYHITGFNSKTGEPIFSEGWANIEGAVNKIIENLSSPE